MGQRRTTRKAKPPRVVTLRLDEQAVEALRALARRKGVKSSALARAWIAERLRDELRAGTKALRRAK